MSTDDARPPGRGWRVAALVIVITYVAGAVALGWAERSIASHPPRSSLLESVGMLLGFGWFALVGAIVVSRQPHNVMGWLLAAPALCLALLGGSHNLAAYLVLERGVEPGLLVSLLAWPNNWYWPLVTSVMFIAIPILFPSGHLPSRRWRFVGWAGAVGVAGICLLGALAERIGFQVTGGPGQDVVTIANPLGITGLAHPEDLAAAIIFWILLGLAHLGAFASLVVRFRRGTAVERQQMKWLILAISLVPIAMLLETVGGQVAEQLQGIGFLMFVNGIPLAIGLAVLRYRLYDIDRIINRAAVYTALTIVLVGLYWGLVLTLQSVFNPVLGGSDLVIAASTLAVAAAFVPVRKRLQRFVDRRFNRARYDAQRTVDGFSRRLRDEVDLEVLRTEILAVVGETMHPRSVDLWSPPVGEVVAR